MPDFDIGSVTKWLPGAATVLSSFLGMEGANQQAAGADLSAEGALLTGRNARLAGQQKRVALEFQADQLDQQGSQAIAVSQRQAIEQERVAKLTASRALAVAGAAGVNASDPSMIRLISSVAGEGYLRASTALYAGREQARLLEMGAAGKRFEGANAEILGAEQEKAYEMQAAGYGRQAGAYRASGLGSLAQGAAGMFAKYGAGGPKADTPSPDTGYDSWDFNATPIADAWLDF